MAKKPVSWDMIYELGAELGAKRETVHIWKCRGLTDAQKWRLAEQARKRRLTLTGQDFEALRLSR